MNENTVIDVVLLLAALVFLKLQAWRAVLAVAPQAVKLEADTPADVTVVPPELMDAWDDLQKLGFQLLGSHTEKVPFASARWFLDAKHATEPVFASLTVGRDEQDHVFLLTQSDKGFVITANYKRPATEVPGAYLAGGLEGVSPERLLKAHLRRVPEIGPVKPLVSLDDRLAAARDWYTETGKAELRQQHAVGLLWTLGALGMVAAALFRLVA